MRWFNLAVIVLFLLVTVIFALQNLESVTIAFLGFSMSAPLAIIGILAYLLGMATGGSLFSLLRRSIEGYRRTANTTQ